MRLLSTPLLALCATSLLSSPLLGQTPNRQDGRPRAAILERLDTNGDGKISAEEAQAGREAFKERGGIQSLPEPMRNAIIKHLGKNDDAKGADRRSDAKGADRRSDAKGADRRSDAKGTDRRSDAKGADRRPDAKGKRPDGQNSGLGHLARFDLNGDGVIDAEEAQNARALMQRLRGGNGTNKNSDGQKERPQSNKQRSVRDSGPSRGAGPGPGGPGVRGPQGDRGQRDNIRGKGAQQRQDVRRRGPGQNTARRRPTTQDMRRRIQSTRERAGREGENSRPQRRR